MTNVPRLLEAAAAGDRHTAAQLFPLVYKELRCLANARVAAEAPGGTLNSLNNLLKAYFVADRPKRLPWGRSCWHSCGRRFRPSTGIATGDTQMSSLINSMTRRGE